MADDLDDIRYVRRSLREARTVDELARRTEEELRRIEGALGLTIDGYLPQFNVVPERPREGMVRNADGTNWNPGSGKGVYVYLDSRWVQMSESNLFLEIAKGNIAGSTFVHKFGSSSVSTSLQPVCNGGFYRTPTSTVTLAVISSSANDTAAGSGAREVTLQYLDSSFNLQTGTIATNGTTESTETIAGVLRLVRAWVSDSGTYATQSAASQAGTITIRVESAGDTWATIPEVDTGFGAGQSLIGAYTIPAGKTGYILTSTLSTDSTKSVDFYFFKRENANDVTAGYPAMRIQNVYIGVSGIFETTHSTYESYPEYTDLGFLAKAASASDVAVEFELLLVDN